MFTKKYDVPKIIKPILNALVVAAPTYQITISTKDNGADNNS